MDELNTNTNLTSNNKEEEQSSSFVLQESVNNDQYEENREYQLKVPLSVSQIYKDEYFDHFHLNYYGELEHDGLFLASIQSIPIESNNEEDNQLIQAIIRTKTNNYNVSEIINLKNEEYILQMLFIKAHLSPIRSYELIHHIKANEKLLEFDKYNDDQYSNKVALIYQSLNQTNENEILSNNQITNEMKNFLNLISERIELKDFNNYRGDLDIKTNSHGYYSYFTKYHHHQIMFNIAPIIPSDKNDQQFIQRKSLIANALLCIVFQEQGTLFKPNFILGKVTQVYITVQPIDINSQLHYKIEIWRRSNIEPIVHPSGGIFKHDESFRDYFLTLILNTMNIIFKKEFFYSRIIEQRQRLKNDFMQKLIHLFDSYTKDKNFFDKEILNLTKQIPIKRHRFSLIPKIIGTFRNNRTSLSSKSAIKSQSIDTLVNSNISFEQEEFEQSTDTIAALIRNMIDFIELNNEILLSTSSIDKNTINQKKDKDQISG